MPLASMPAKKALKLTPVAAARAWETCSRSWQLHPQAVPVLLKSRAMSVPCSVDCYAQIRLAVLHLNSLDFQGPEREQHYQCRKQLLVTTVAS